MLYILKEMQVDASCIRFRQDWVQSDDAHNFTWLLHIIRMICILFHSRLFFSFFFCTVGFHHI
jgi:hypothetical protein